MRVGATVARFQTDVLHHGHDALLHHLEKDNDVVCVLLGTTENRGSRRNPLDFVTRKMMVEEFGFRRPVVVLPIPDHPDDAVWSASVDELLQRTFVGAQISLVGSRDSFTKVYSGKLDVTTLDSTIPESSTERRFLAAQCPWKSEAFRKGVIYGAYNQWPRVFMCADTALLLGKELLVLGKRKGVQGAMFFGGFVDQGDTSLEAAATRELAEEAGVEGARLEYVGSFQVPDYRYKTPDDGLIMTALFLARAPYSYEPEAGDDIDSLVMYPLDTDQETLMDAVRHPHRLLMYNVLRHLRQKGEYHG